MQKINYFAYFNKSGYAMSAFDYIFAIRRYFDIKITPFGSIDQCSLSPFGLKEVNNMIRNPLNEHNINIFHCIPTMQKNFIVKGKRVGFGVFETFNPPNEWVEILNTDDAIICPSEFNVKIFKQAGLKKPIFHIPHCVDFDTYKSIKRNKNEKFTFLFIGTWRKRKGWNILLEAWMKEFDKNDNVQLVIKTDRFSLANQSIENVKKELGLEKKELAPITFECKTMSEIELAELYGRVDCLVSPSLGEGFGLFGIQSLAAGTPVLTTMFGGVADWANEDTVTQIEHDGFVVYNELDKIPQFNNSRWMHITDMEVAKKMRWVLNNYNDVLEKTKKAYDYIFQKFNYNITAERFQEMIDQLK